MHYEFNPNIPYYYQIKEDILQKIDRGIYSVGDQLPSEIELAKEYGVSRPTVRQAIAELVQEGVLVRGRGKGTFVSSPIISDDAQVFSTFMQPDENDTKHHTKVLKVNRVRIWANAARELGISPGSEAHEIIILRMSGEETVAVRTLQIPVSLVPEINEANLNNNTIYEILQRNYGLIPSGAVQSFQSVSAGEEEAALFDIEMGDPLMLWQGIVYTLHNKPMMRVKTLFRGDRYKFYITQGKVELDRSDLNPLTKGMPGGF